MKNLYEHEDAKSGNVWRGNMKFAMESNVSTGILTLVIL